MAKSERKSHSKRELLRYLIRNYNRIHDRCDKEILDRLEAEKAHSYSLEWFADLMEGRDPDAWADKMRESSHRTEELIMALDFALLAYRNVARTEGHRSWRQYDALYSRYFSTFSGAVWEIGWKYGVSKSVIYEDLQIAESRLESLLLGENDGENEDGDNYFSTK